MDHFRFMAPLYDAVFGRPGVDWWKQTLQLPATGWILDVGGGTGRVSAVLPGLAAGVAVCDVSRPMLARTRHKNGIQPIQAAAEALPFPDAVFHRALVVDALHHFRNQRRAISELARVLAPGGRLVVEEPDIGLMAVKAVAFMERLALMGSRFYPPETIADMMAAAGLRPRIERRAQFRAWISGVKDGVNSLSDDG